MVEADIAPAGRGVAAFAEIAARNMLDRLAYGGCSVMAGRAARRSSFEAAARVAAFAIQAEVFAGERKDGVEMIEDLGAFFLRMRYR